MLGRSIRRLVGYAFGLIVLLTITGCPTHPPITPTTQILHFTATPNPVPPGGVTRLSWHAIEPGVFAGAASCSLSSHTYGEPEPLPANEVECQGTRDFTIAANVSFQLSVLEHPYDPDDPQPYLTQAVLVTTTATPVTVDIEPPSVTLQVNETQSFTATVTGATDSRVTWSATCGSTSGSGNTITYTAPATAGACILTATSTADTSRSATATIDAQRDSTAPWRLEPSPLIFEGLPGGTAPPPQSLTIHNDATSPRSFTLSSTTMVNLNPTTGTLPAGGSARISVSVEACPPYDPPGTTTSTVTATGDGATGTASVARTCGEVSDVGMIDVIITGLPNDTDADVFIEGQGWQLWPRTSVLLPDMPPGSYQMTASAVTASGTTYQPTPTSTGFTVTAGETTTVAIAYAPVIGISLSPTSASLPPSGTQSFTATVTGTTDTTVTWNLTPDGGTLTGTGNTRTYTAPATGPATCVLTATSVADPTRQADAMITVEVLPAGEVLWARQFGTTSTDAAQAVAVDASGNVLVAGETWASLAGSHLGQNDAFVRMYDANGNELWTRQFGTSGFDYVRGLAVDGVGNVLVTGFTGSLAGMDAFVQKYDTNGNQLWYRQFGTDDSDYAGRVGVDAAGNVLVSGRTYGSLAGASAGGMDAFVRKYDPNGNVLWTRQFGTSDIDYTEGLAVDAAGDVLVAGNTGGSLAGSNYGGFDAFVRKYDLNGSVLWTRQFGTNVDDHVRDAAADASGNLLLAGYTSGSLADGGAGGIDAFVRKYDPNGNVLWTRQFGNSADDSAYGVGVDASGNVLVAGETYGSLAGASAGLTDAFVRKYDPNGNLLWTRQTGSDDHDSARAVAADASGNALVAGETYGALAGGSAGLSDAFVQKLSP